MICGFAQFEIEG